MVDEYEAEADGRLPELPEQQQQQIPPQAATTSQSPDPKPETATEDAAKNSEAEEAQNKSDQTTKSDASPSRSPVQKLPVIGKVADIMGSLGKTLFWPGERFWSDLDERM